MNILGARALILGYVLIVFSAVSGCSSSEEKLAKSVVKMSADERSQTLSRLSPETQLYIYTYAYTRNEPPIILAKEIAADWKSVLPVLEARLKSENNETVLAGLIMILPVISANYCTLSGREDVLSAAAQAAAKLGPPYRELAEKQVEEIRHLDTNLPTCR